MDLRRVPTLGYIVMLATVAIVGIGLLVWLAPVTAADMTPAQESLLNIGDWIVKASIGAMLGFGGARLASKNGSGEST